MTPSLVARVFKVGIILIGCALFSGCGPGKTAKDAEKVVARYFQAIATNSYTELGTYVSHAPKLFKVTRSKSRAGARTSVVIICRVTYSKHSAKETFTLVRDRGNRDFKIVDHNVSLIE